VPELRIQSKQLAVERVAHPAKRHVSRRIARVGQHPMDVFPGKAADMRIITNVQRVIIVEKFVAKHAAEHEDDNAEQRRNQHVLGRAR